MMRREDPEKSECSNLELNPRPPVSSSDVTTLKNAGAKPFKVRFKAVRILGMVSLRTTLCFCHSRRVKFLK